MNKKTAPVTISSLTYTLDAVGNRTGMTGLAGSQSYNYDALYRITNPNYTGQSDAYSYDANGNRTLYNEVQYSYDAADQLTCARFWWEQWCPSGGTSYGYDANGNQTSRGSDSFTYDHENRLTASDIDSVGATYEYNGDGLRVTRTIDQTSVSYVWDVAGGLPVILQDSQGNSYVYGLDLISRTDSGGNQEYYLYDGLGSTTDLVDGSGTVDATYSYYVFGAIRWQSGSSPNQWLFTGEQEDTDSGLYYLRARYYDPAIGRFLSQDPAGAGHPYAYVENNPVNFVDPAGLQAVGNSAAAACATAAVVGGTATAATAGGGGVTVVAAGGGVTAVCAGALAIAVCDAGGCEALADAAGALGGAIVSGGETLVEGAGDVAGKVGGWLGLSKKGSDPYWKGHPKRQIPITPPNVWYPSWSSLLPPGWDCYRQFPAWFCKGVVPGTGIIIGAGYTIGKLLEEAGQFPPLLRGEKLP